MSADLLTSIVARFTPWLLNWEPINGETFLDFYGDVLDEAIDRHFASNSAALPFAQVPLPLPTSKKRPRARERAPYRPMHPVSELDRAAARKALLRTGNVIALKVKK